MTFSISFDGHQWNIPVESYLFTFMSMFSICSFPGIRRGSCRLGKQNNALIIRPFYETTTAQKRGARPPWPPSVKLSTWLDTVGPTTTISFLHSFSSLVSSHHKTRRPSCSQWCREQQDVSATDWIAWQHKANYQLLPSPPLPDAMRRR